MTTIALRELRDLLRTPLGWVLLAVSQFVLAWWYLMLVDRYRGHYEPLLARIGSTLGVGDLVVAPFFGGSPVLAVLLVLTAALGMRTITEERRAGTLPLVLGSPRSAAAIVLGKYLGGLGFLTIAAALWGLMPLSLALGTAIDFGRLAAGLLGLWLMGAGLLALALLTASLTRHAAAAVSAAFAAGLLLLVLGRRVEDGWLARIALTGHYEGFVAGTVALADLIYFVLLAAVCLSLTAWRLERLREAP